MSENAFSEMCQSVEEAPDPSKGLEMAVDLAHRISGLENEIRKQAQELAEYSVESQEIKNQHSTIRRLEEKIRSLENNLQFQESERVSLENV